MGAEDPRGSDGYGDALERAAWRDELPGLIRLSGSDAISFLHNVLTNDIESLGPGQARYTAYLTPQGRMISDADVIRRADDVLLAVESSVATPSGCGTSMPSDLGLRGGMRLALRR